MAVRYYLAYGSNLNKAQMARRCPDAVAVGTGVLPDCRLLFRGSSSGYYLTVEKFRGASVPVAVWRISAADEKALDRYEGYPAFYTKKSVKLICQEESVNNPGVKVSMMVSGFMYVMVRDRPAGLPSRRYMETCLRGYLDFGIYNGPLNRAVMDTMREMENERQ